MSNLLDECKAQYNTTTVCKLEIEAEYALVKEAILRSAKHGAKYIVFVPRDFIHLLAVQRLLQKEGFKTKPDFICTDLGYATEVLFVEGWA